MGALSTAFHYKVNSTWVSGPAILQCGSGSVFFTFVFDIHANNTLQIYGKHITMLVSSLVNFDWLEEEYNFLAKACNYLKNVKQWIDMFLIGKT